MRVKGCEASKPIFTPVPVPVFGVMGQCDVFLEPFHGPGAVLNLVSHVLCFANVSKVRGSPEIHEGSVTWSSGNS